MPIFCNVSALAFGRTFGIPLYVRLFLSCSLFYHGESCSGVATFNEGVWLLNPERLHYDLHFSSTQVVSFSIRRRLNAMTSDL